MFYIEAVMRGGLFQRVQYVTTWTAREGVHRSIRETCFPIEFHFEWGRPVFIGRMPVRTDVKVMPL